MSFVNVFLVRDDSLYFVRMHYRELDALMKKPEEYLKKLRPKFLDAGYVVMDLNRNLVFDGQFGCHLREVGEFAVFR